MGKQSIQKAKLIKREPTTSKNGHPSTTVTYTWLDNKDGPKDMTLQWVNQYLNDDSWKIFESLKEGDEFVIVKEEEGKFWNFKELRDISTWAPKPVWDGKSNNPTGKYRGSSSSYDQYGATIGMMFNNAVLICLKEGNYDKDKALKIAKGLVKDVQEFDMYARPILEQGKNPQSEESKLKQESHNQDLDSDESVPF